MEVTPVARRIDKFQHFWPLGSLAKWNMKRKVTYSRTIEGSEIFLVDELVLKMKGMNINEQPSTLLSVMKLERCI